MYPWGGNLTPEPGSALGGGLPGGWVPSRLDRRLGLVESRRVNLSTVRSLLVLGLLATSVATSTAGCQPCMTALTTGVLVANGSDLVLQDPSGTSRRVRWPQGYRVSKEGDRLVLTDFFGSVQAREGDRIEMGGGFGTDNVFAGCGGVTVVPQSVPS